MARSQPIDQKEPLSAEKSKKGPIHPMVRHPQPGNWFNVLLKGDEVHVEYVRPEHGPLVSNQQGM